MLQETRNTFNPDYAIHPGEILEEFLCAHNMKKVEFAERSGISVKTVSQIINCKDPITPETAIKIERVLGVSASLWNNLDANYKLYLAKKEEAQISKGMASWAKQFPINDIIKRGFINKPLNDDDCVNKMLTFFSVASADAYCDRFNSLAASVAYRRSYSFKSAPASVATWLRVGEILSDNIDAKPFDKIAFESALSKIRTLTVKSPEIFQPIMEALCREAGVILLFVPEFAHTCIFGATRWLSKDRALIMLSLRYKTDDHFWFSVYHEAAHVLLHGKKKLYIDEEGVAESDEEKEANQYASKMLIPEDKYMRYLNLNRISRISIRNFAKSIGISPGVVVGRLQHDGKILFKEYNDLKKSYHFIEPHKEDKHV